MVALAVPTSSPSKLAIRASVLDLSGRPADPFGKAWGKGSVFVFLTVDCPISNRYAPVIRQYYRQYHMKGIGFRLVYPDPGLSASDVRKHLATFGYVMPAYRDPAHVLVKQTGARVTPEVAVFDTSKRLVYHGRIDNKFVTFGQARPAATVHDLRNVLDALLAGKSLRPTSAKAVGCYIPGS